MASLVSLAPTIVSGTSSGSNGDAPPRDRNEWKIGDAQAAVSSSYVGRDAEANRVSTYEYIQGFHYQDARPWMGAGYSVTGTLPDSSKAIINRQLTPVPEMFACLERRVEGACGIQAAITLAPADPQGAEGDDGERAPSDAQMAFVRDWIADVSAWWDAEQVWGGKNLRKPTGVRGAALRASVSQTGASCLRVFFNPASLTETVTIRGEGGVERQAKAVRTRKDRRDGLRQIRFVAPPPERCAVYTDPDTLEKTGVFLWTDADNQENAEIWFARDNARGERVTVLRSLNSGTTDATVTEYPFGGWLPIQQIEAGCIVTDAVRRLQAALDFTGTSGSRLTQTHAYSQRTESNAAPDGYWDTTPPPVSEVPAPDTREDANGNIQYFWPTPAGLGPEIIRRLVGISYISGQNDKGDTYGMTSPSVAYHEPSSIASLIEWLDAVTMIMRNACYQGHIRSGLLGSTAEASGEAYEQARTAFVKDITGLAEAIDGPLAAILVVATIMAEWLAGNDSPAEFANDWTVGVQGHPSAGAPSSESQRTTLEMVNGELLDPEEGTARLGVQDVAAVRARIATARTLDAELKRQQIISGYVSSGASFVAAAMRTGLTEKEATDLAQSDGLPNVQQ